MIKTFLLPSIDNVDKFDSDIINNGVYFVGGMSQINGLENFLKRKFKYPFKIVEDGENVTILGAGKLLDDLKLLESITENI